MNPLNALPGVACTEWLDSAQWMVEHRADGLSFLGVPARDRRNPSKVIRPYWIGPLTPDAANWLMDAIQAKQSNKD